MSVRDAAVLEDAVTSPEPRFRRTSALESPGPLEEAAKRDPNSGSGRRPSGEVSRDTAPVGVPGCGCIADRRPPSADAPTWESGCCKGAPLASACAAPRFPLAPSSAAWKACPGSRALPLLMLSNRMVCEVASPMPLASEVPAAAPAHSPATCVACPIPTATPLWEFSSRISPGRSPPRTRLVARAPAAVSDVPAALFDESNIAAALGSAGIKPSATRSLPCSSPRGSGWFNTAGSRRERSTSSMEAS